MTSCPQCASREREFRPHLVDQDRGMLMPCPNDWHERPGLSAPLFVLALMLTVTVLVNVPLFLL